MTTGLRLDAAVLAAGAGKRFGGRKLTTEWENSGLLLEGALRAAFATSAERVMVVTGADEGVGEVAKRFAEGIAQPDRLEIVVAAGWEHGLSISLKAAVIFSQMSGANGLFVFLGDMPRVPTSIFPEMIEALDSGAAAVAPVFHGQRGHPVLFGPQLFDELLELEGDKGANGLLDALGERLTTVVSPDDGVLFDIDVRGDG